LGISNFLGDKLRGYEQKVCKAEIIRLIELLEDYHKSFELFENLIIELRREIGKPELNDDQIKENLHALKNAIRANKKIEEMPVAAFLAADLTAKGQTLEIRMLKAVIFISSYHLFNLTGYEEVVKRAMREFRLMIERLNGRMINLLPDFTQDLSTVVSGIKKSRKICSDKAMDRRMGCIQALLDDFLKNKPVYSRNRLRSSTSDSTEKKGGNYQRKSSLALDEDDDFTYTGYLVRQQADYLVDVDHQEREGDQDRVSKYMSIKVIAPEAVTKSLALQNQRAKQIANQLVKREKQLSADWRYLTDFEIETFLNESFTQYSSDVSGVYMYLLLSLFSGRNIIEIVGMEKYRKEAPEFGWRQNNESIDLVYSLPLPEHRVKPRLESLIRRSSSELCISMPNCIGHVFLQQHERVDRSSIVDKAKAVLVEINKRCGTRLTINRLSNYMRYWFSRMGVDAVEVNLLLGDVSLQQAGIYYYQVGREKLLKEHHSYCAYLLRKTGIKNEFREVATGQDKVGSQLQILEDKVQEFFQAVQKKVIACRLKRNGSIEEFHNWYTVFILHLLNVSTGHRPVKNPYDSLRYFDLLGGTIFISDKEVRSELSARVLVLPEVVLKQIFEYLSHLEVLKDYFVDINSAIFETLVSVENGDEPLLFFFDESRIEFVEPRLLQKKLKDVLSLPLNWHRHFMRTKLRQMGFSGERVDCWMGHAAFDGEAFSRFSASAVSDLKEIAEEIDGYLTTQLCISPMAGWGDKA